jgi:glutathione S-transferase
MAPIFPALVTVLALLVYTAVFMATARARARHGIQAPAVTGAPEFERAFRIQQNTLEQLIWFLPSLWLFAFYVSPTWGGILGLVWVGGRIHYALSYYRDPEARGPGFITGFASAAVLLVGPFFGILADLL